MNTTQPSLEDVNWTYLCFPSIRQYELKEHTDLNMNKVYSGEIGRIKSFENQKP